VGFEKNLQGDIVAVYNSFGLKLVTYTYDAWGNATTTYHNGGASTLAANNPIRYRGYYYDTTLQMYYLQSRYYDAKICRFINADSALYHSMLGYNMFAYCGNNPVNRFDSTGKYYEDLWNNYGDPLDDWFFDGITGGGSYYYGPGSAYYNYTVYSKRSISDANIIGYYSGGLSSGITNYGYYVVPGAISVTDIMATSSSKTSNVRNPWGKKGGLHHQSTINLVKNIYEDMGYRVDTEVRIDIVNGNKPYRFADLSITDTKGYTFYINVGKELKSGFPCAREQYAINDVKGSGYVIFFIPYN
jgi:RHS repeat-associated protein